MSKNLVPIQCTYLMAILLAMYESCFKFLHTQQLLSIIAHTKCTRPEHSFPIFLYHQTCRGEPSAHLDAVSLANFISEIKSSPQVVFDCIADSPGNSNAVLSFLANALK